MERRLADAAKLLARQFIAGIVDVSRHATKRILHQGAVAIGVEGLGKHDVGPVLKDS